MRCDCCNNILSDYEATLKFKGSGEYSNMCTTCIKELPDDIEFIRRNDLLEEEGGAEFESEEEPKNEYVP